MIPALTIVVATYNCERLIRRCLESIYNQSIPVEVWVVDNCSTDKTVDIVLSYSHHGVKLLIEKDRGVFDAWNKGVQRASGEWIIFIGADDYFPASDSLQSLVNFISSSDSACKIFYGSVIVVDEMGKTVRVENNRWELISSRLSVTLPFTHVGTAHHCTLFENGNRFDPSFRIAGDYDFLFTELKSVGASYVKDYKISMQLGGLSTSYKNRLLLISEIEKICRRYSIDRTTKEKLWITIKKFVFALMILAMKITSKQFWCPKL